MWLLDTLESLATWTALYLLAEWAVRLAMLVYVPQKRPPSAARTWLLLIFAFPFPGLILYSMFGRIHMSKKRLAAHAEVSNHLKKTGRAFFSAHSTHPELPPQFIEAVRLAENLGDFPIMGGNEVELLPGYELPLSRLIADIEAAREHVHLLYYIFADDATGGRVADALAAAASRGVTCRLLVDGLGAKRIWRRIAPRLEAARVEVIEVLPMRLFRRGPARLDLRNHRKIAVIDGKIGYVGSQNVVDADFKRGIVYEELVARVNGPIVLELQGVILGDRFLETHDPELDPAYFPTFEPRGTVLAQILPSGPAYPQANNQRLIVSLIYAAQERVVITTPYFIPDEPLLQALQAAVLGGVDVHLVVSEKADQFLVGFAQRSFYDELLEAGVKIHLHGPKFLHAKHVSIDDWVAVIGSSNFDMRSFLLNAEISLLVYDRDVVARLRKIQDENMANARLLTQEEWATRPTLTRTVQNVARLVDSFL